MTKVQHLISVLENKLDNLEDELESLIKQIDNMAPGREREYLLYDKTRLVDQIEYVWQDLDYLKKLDLRQ